MASEERLGNLFTLSKMQEELYRIQDDGEACYTLKSPSCEAAHLFDEDIRLLLEERAADSQKRFERRHERLEETQQKELEAGRRKEIKMEELKSAEERKLKLEKAMQAVTKKDKEKVTAHISSSSSSVDIQTQGQPDTSKDCVGHVEKKWQGKKSRWRQLLIESNKQAKMTRDVAAEEYHQAEEELKQANKEKEAETLKQYHEERVKTEGTKRNLLTKYREARAFQKILEKEEEAQLESQHEREEFFAKKKAAAVRRQLTEDEDRLTEERKCEEMRQREERAERSQKMMARRIELKSMAEEKHRQLWEKYQQAEAILDDSGNLSTKRMEDVDSAETTEEWNCQNTFVWVLQAIWDVVNFLIRPCEGCEGQDG